MAASHLPTARPPLAYRAGRHVARWLVQAYYPDLATTGLDRVPDGPLIVAANHPNSIFDPVLVSTSFPRAIRWLAKAPLFDSRPARFLLGAFGVIPVKRRHEGGDKQSTSALMRTAADALLEGHAIGIFPEGTTHDQPRLLPLKTGVGRIAVLAAGEAPPGVRVRVLPVVLHFADKARFRSEAVVAIGEPIDVAAGDDPETVTTTVRAALERAVVHVEDDEQERLFEALRVHERRRLSIDAGADDPAARHRLDVEIARAIRRFAREEPERVDEFHRRLRAHLDRLERHGVSPEAFATHDALRERRRRRTILALALLPIALYGALHSWLPYRLTSLLASWQARPTDRTTLAWFRWASGVVVLPLAWLLEALLVLAAWGALPAVLFLTTAPITGLVARWGFHVLRRHVGRLRDRLVIGARPEVAESLRQEGAWLTEQVERWRQLHRAGPAAAPAAPATASATAPTTAPPTAAPLDPHRRPDPSAMT